MPRPIHERPTPGELEVLKILWEQGPSTVREVMDVLNRRRRRAYTSVMSLLEVMTEKRLLRREPQGRAYVYRASVAKKRTLGRLAQDLLGRVFDGSAKSLMAHLLDGGVAPEDLEEIRRLIDEYERVQGER